MNDLVGHLRHRGPGDLLQGDPRHHDVRTGGTGKSQQTGGVNIRRVLAITPEADHATGDAIGIMMTGTDATREGAQVLMIGIEGGPHEGPLHHLVDQVRRRSKVITL